MAHLKAALVAAFLAQPVAGICSSLSNAETFFEQGRFYFAHRDYVRAAISFELAMQRNPANADALYYDALTYQRAGDLQRAKALYKHTVAIFPGTKAAQYAWQGLKAIASQAPNAKQNELSLAEALKSLAQQQATEQQAEKVPEKTPSPKAAQSDPVTQLIAKGKALQEDGRANEAERQFREALTESEKGGQTDLKIADALQALGEYYVENGSYGKACDFYRRELKLRELAYRHNPDGLAGCMTRQATIFTKDGDYGTAEELLRRCIDIYQDDLDRAERDHKRTIGQRQQLVAAKSSLAAILRVTNRMSEAKSIEQEIKSIQPP